LTKEIIKIILNIAYIMDADKEEAEKILES